MFDEYDPRMRRFIKILVLFVIVLSVFLGLSYLMTLLGCASEAQQYAQMNHLNCVVEPLRENRNSETFLVRCKDGRKPFEETINKRKRR